MQHLWSPIRWNAIYEVCLYLLCKLRAASPGAWVKRYVVIQISEWPDSMAGQLGGQVYGKAERTRRAGSSSDTNKSHDFNHHLSSVC